MRAGLDGGSAADLAWRVLIVVMAVFFLPSLSMGTVSPVVAKLAVDRLRQSNRHRHGDRSGVRLGHGRQHPRHVLDGIRAD